jgi:hypothetical protein
VIGDVTFYLDLMEVRIRVSLVVRPVRSLTKLLGMGFALEKQNISIRATEGG